MAGPFGHERGIEPLGSLVANLAERGARGETGAPQHCSKEKNLMNVKSRSVRLVGFVAAAASTAALVAFATGSTGAYFTDSHSGTISSSTGHVTLQNVSNTTLNWTNLNPGEYTSKTITYKTSSTQNTDIWLYFPAGDDYARFTGNSGDGVPDGRGGSGGMGRYGHFAVANNAGTTLFSSYNLADSDTADTISGCANANGHGYGPPATSSSDTPPYCGVPHYIQLETNVPNGTNAQVTLTFGITGRATGQNEAQPATSVPFQIVATQTGHRPDASNF